MLKNGTKKTPLVFAKKKKIEEPEASEQPCWKILIVDDEPEIHRVTKLVLTDFSYLDRKIQFISAFSKEEARTLLQDNPDIAVILLDVVMEEDDSGLQLVREIREHEKNNFVRIILRTGQPGQAPEKSVIVNYDINDYKAKAELTSEKLFTTVVASLRSYELLLKVEKATGDKVRLQVELETTAAVQKALFPREMPFVDNMSFATFFDSASHAAGDWYGFMTSIKDHLYILIGDVTGHGAPAALVTATASASSRLMETIHSYPENRRALSPSAFLGSLNTNIYLAGSPDFLMTFFAVAINLKTGMMSFSNAGHNFPVLINKDGNIKHLLNVNKRLGDQKHFEFTEQNIQLEEGDLLLLYTDGLVENGKDDGEMWGERRLKRHLKQIHKNPVSSVVDSVVKEAYSFLDDCPITDDLTVVGCQVNSPFPARLS